MIMRRPKPEAKSASLLRTADLHLEREPFDHESNEESHIRTARTDAHELKLI